MSSSESDEAEDGEFITITDNYERVCAYFYPDAEGYGKFTDSNEITQGYITYMDEDDEDNSECHTFTDSSDITTGYFTPQEDDDGDEVSDSNEITLGYVMKEDKTLTISDENEGTLGYAKIKKDSVKIVNQHEQILGYIVGEATETQIKLVVAYLFFIPGGRFLSKYA